MSEYSFSETSNQSWFERLTGAIKGVLVGIVLFIVAFPLLWWNEGRAVHTAKGLQEAGGSVASISTDAVDRTADRKLVHATAMATTSETLSDPEFSISMPAIKLKRLVEMYQWTEKKSTKTVKKLGGGEERKTVYEYEKKWSEKHIDSTKFNSRAKNHANPESMRFSSAEYPCMTVTFGAYTLTAGLVDQMPYGEKLPLSDKDRDRLPSDLKKQLRIVDNAFYLPIDVKGDSRTPEGPADDKPDPDAQGADEQPGDSKSTDQKSSDSKSTESKPAEAKSPDEPADKPNIGDLRISFQAVVPATVSILARQTGNSFEPWQSSAGTTIDRLMMGSVSAPAMIDKMESENTMLTWILRAVGFVLMAVGVGLIFNPLVVLADVLPLLGDVLGMGVGLFAFLVAAFFSLITIAAAWLAYRPLIGVGLIAIAVLLVIGVKRLGRKKPLPLAISR